MFLSLFHATLEMIESVSLGSGVDTLLPSSSTTPIHININHLLIL